MIYFASDVHLGLQFKDHDPIDRERNFVKFLSQIEHDCTELFLLGDVFDFWFEWRRTIPRGYVRLLSKLTSMVENGIKIHFFTGNHDLWVGDYLQKEIGLDIHLGHIIIERGGKTLFLAHGDTFYRHKPVGRILEKIFRSSWARWIGQRMIHPDAMVRFGMSWSHSNREKRGGVAHVFGGEDDFLVKFSRAYLATENPNIDYFIFGHEHTPVVYPLTDRTDMIILGEWVEQPFYARMKGDMIELIPFL